jgi:glycosyltransferase involved in cell wall biosynthesis
MTADWLVQLDHEVVNARLRQADAIVGCSEYVTDKIRTAFPQYAERCSTVFPGVDVEKIADGTSRPRDYRRSRVVFVGRVSPEKGLHVLIEAFERVLNKHPESHLEIIGGEFVTPLEFTVGVSDDPMVRGLSRFYRGSYLQSLRDQVKGKLKERVTFLSYLPRAKMIEHVRQGDLFVQPSIGSEMFGMAVAEAMAAGIPVVATRICGLPELVADGETGLLVGPDDPEALAGAIIHLLDDAHLSEQMGRAGRARVERLFSWDKTVAALEHVYLSERPRS